MMHEFLKKLAPTKSSLPVLMLVGAVLVYAMLTLRLGFYQDDWEHVYFYVTGGAQGISDYMFFASRPFAGLVYNFFFGLLGARPMLWHALMALLVYLTALGFWQALNLVWPQQAGMNALTALLFMVYPLFSLHVLSVSYALHWSMYAVFMWSLWAMLRAVVPGELHPRRWLALGLVLQVFQLLMIEYYAGAEFARPVLIWLMLTALPLRERLKTTLKHWWPYLVVFVAYAVFRSQYGVIFDYDLKGSATLDGLLTAPLDTLRSLAQVGVQDVVETLFATWHQTLTPELFDFSYFSTPFVWGAAAFLGALIWFWAYYLREEETSDNNFHAGHVILAGVILSVAGLLPGWYIGRSVSDSTLLWNGRFGLGAILGASLFWLGLIQALVPYRGRKILIFAVLIALAAGVQWRTQLQANTSWENQLRIYWQLVWRAPALTPGTAIVTANEFFGFMGHYPTGYAINLLYPKSSPYTQMDYWFFSGPSRLPDDMDAYRAGTPLKFFKYPPVVFQGNSLNNLTTHYDSDEVQCLWVLDPKDSRIYWLPALTLETLPVSNPARIDLSLPTAQPMEAIFGKEPAPNWCYYYQKADLAYQQGDWNKVTALWQTARENGFRPRVAFEYLNFIDAFAFTGNWSEAATLSQAAATLDFRMPELLCTIWDEYQATQPASPEQSAAQETIRADLKCTKP